MSAYSSNRWRITAWGVAVLLLLLPLVAMQFTDEVAWTLVDFVVFALLLGGTGAAFELAVRATGNGAYRAAAGVALAAAFLLVWLNGAVGIIGNAQNPANLMFAGVLAIGITGALIARFRPSGTARAMLATAFAQASVAAIAISAGPGVAHKQWPWDILFLSGFFAALWLLSAWLFRESAGKDGCRGEPAH